MSRLLIGTAVVLLLGAVTLLISGNRILISEQRVPAGQPVWEDGYNGDKADQDQLVCRYFTGRSVKTTVFWHSPNGVMGKDECPFLLSVSQ